MPTPYADDDKDKELMESITGRLRERVNDWYGNSASLAAFPEIRCYTNSFLLRYRVTAPKGNKAILVKIRRNPKMTSLSTAIRVPDIHVNIPDEYNTLKYVYPVIGEAHPNFAAIRPLDYFEDYFAIVMEEFPSRSLRQLLQKQRNKENGELQMIARRAGELLRFFHEQVYSTTACPYSTDDILADAEVYALQLQQHSGGRISKRSILDTIAQKLSPLGITSVPYTSAHQDLTCDNVLYSEDGKVCLIDIKVKPAPIYSDLGLLLIHPETFRNQIFRDGRYFSPQFLTRYRAWILKGYFASSAIDEGLVNVYAAIRVLDKWVMHQDLFYRYKGLKRVLTRPLSPLVTTYFQKLWKSRLQNTA